MELWWKISILSFFLPFKCRRTLLREPCGTFVYCAAVQGAAVALVLTDGPRVSAGFVLHAHSPHTQLFSTALLILHTLLQTRERTLSENKLSGTTSSFCTLRTLSQCEVKKSLTMFVDLHNTHLELLMLYRQ